LATETGQHFPNALSSLPNDILEGCNFRTCKSVVLFNGDICKIGDWVLAASSTQGAGSSPIVACVREIIQRQGSDADKLLRPDAILLECGIIGNPVVSYSMPAVRAHGEYLLYPVEVCDLSAEWHLYHQLLIEPSLSKQILCTANLQHRCQVYNCGASESDIEFIYEERAKTSKAKVVIRHNGDPDDLILNTARMHDAKHMQSLRVPIQPPDMNLAILEGAAREIRTRSNNITTGPEASASSSKSVCGLHGRSTRGRQVNTSLQQHSQIQSVLRA